jgi:hypothetical protein
VNGALFVVLAVLVIGGGWYVHVQRKPWKTCRACDGNKRIKGVIPRTHADCKRCGATGRVRRVGARGEK